MCCSCDCESDLLSCVVVVDYGRLIDIPSCVVVVDCGSRCGWYHHHWPEYSHSTSYKFASSD